MMDLSGSLNLRITSNATKALDLSTPQDNISVNSTVSFSDGTGADKCNQHWSDTRTLADGANEVLDLAGSLVDAFGDTITFANIKALYLYNKSADANLIVGGAASNAFSAFFGDSSDTLIVPPSGRVLLWATASASGYAVTGGTADQLQLAHDGTGEDTLEYDIVIIGEVAEA